MSAQAKGEKVFRGIAVSSGICRGKILVLHRARHVVIRREVIEDQVPAEIDRFEKALVQTRLQILEIQNKVTQNLGAKEADIFEAHLQMLDDPNLLNEVYFLIKEKQSNAEYAFHSTAERFAEALLATNDEYLSQRASDIRDFTARVLDNLLEVKDNFELRHISEPCILVSHDLSPSVTAQLDRKLVLGFATDIGGKTSHTAIMARSLGIPAVVGLELASLELETGDYALLDGYNGAIVVNPTDQTMFQYGQMQQHKATLTEKLNEIKTQPAVTLDGKAIHLSGNIEGPEDIGAILQHGADGVGLYRTEFLFINQAKLPTEEQQYQAYRQVAAALKPHPVIIRTLDLGGDKFATHMQLAPEMNPFLGWRAIRLCLAQPELFCTQLRAILRASAEGNVKMMYPMISGLEELNQANALLEKCRAELRAEGIPFAENMEVGVMIEIPAAVLIADDLARAVKFFSIGSNDLIQYTLAADRTNAKVSYLYEPTHPAIIRLIKMTVEAAHRHGICVGVCGEIAGDPNLAPLLIGLGIDELSTAPTGVAQIKYMIRRLKLTEAEELAKFALGCASPSEIYSRCQALAQANAPSLFEK
jgi:phosphotransferase system enzyme I (PtsI)